MMLLSVGELLLLFYFSVSHKAGLILPSPNLDAFFPSCYKVFIIFAVCEIAFIFPFWAGTLISVKPSKRIREELLKTSSPLDFCFIADNKRPRVKFPRKYSNTPFSQTNSKEQLLFLLRRSHSSEWTRGHAQT